MDNRTGFAWLSAAAVIAGALLIHWNTLASMVAVWIRSETFSHGFLIFPASLYLVWRRRDRLAGLVPSPSAWGLLAVALASFLWLLAVAASVQVIEQYAVVALIPGLVWAMLGGRVAREMAFPLLYLFFAVPAGEILIPYLMDFTAAFTVKAIQLSGVPVHRDGLFFSIPGGDFEVAKACSGVRYLIASVVIGTLYAYLAYRSIWRRLVFVAVAMLLPIMANGLRAYGIVMIAHLSDMQYATGVDHVIYGWIFFGVVMLLLFLAGDLFREKEPVQDEEQAAPGAGPGSSRPGKVIAMTAAAMAVIVAGPALSSYLTELRQSAVSQRQPVLPVAVAGWQGPEQAESDWRPPILGADLELRGRYRNARGAVDLLVFHYTRQSQGHEMVNSENRVYDRKTWFPVREQRQTLRLDDGTVLGLIVSDIRTAEDAQRRVWQWYNVSGRATASPVMAKLYEVLGFLGGEYRDSYLVTLSARYDDTPESAQALLEDFLRLHYAGLSSCLSARAGDPGFCAGKQNLK